MAMETSYDQWKITATSFLVFPRMSIGCCCCCSSMNTRDRSGEDHRVLLFCTDLSKNFKSANCRRVFDRGELPESEYCLS